MEILSRATHVNGWTSRLHELHDSKFPFVTRIEFIRSKLSHFSAHVSGVNKSMERSIERIPSQLPSKLPIRLLPSGSAFFLHTAGLKVFAGLLQGIARCLPSIVRHPFGSRVGYFGMGGRLDMLFRLPRARRRRGTSRRLRKAGFIERNGLCCGPVRHGGSAGGWSSRGGPRVCPRQSLISPQSALHQPRQPGAPPRR